MMNELLEPGQCQRCERLEQQLDDLLLCAECAAQCKLDARCYQCGELAAELDAERAAHAVTRAELAEASGSVLYHKALELAQERDAAKARLRDTCQILVACVGADGPTNAEDAARDVVVEVERLKSCLSTAHEEAIDCNECLAAGGRLVVR